MINRMFTSFSAVQIYELWYIHFLIYSLHFDIFTSGTGLVRIRAGPSSPALEVEAPENIIASFQLAALRCPVVRFHLDYVSRVPWYRNIMEKSGGRLIFLTCRTEALRDSGINFFSILTERTVSEIWLYCCRSEWAWSERARKLSNQRGRVENFDFSFATFWRDVLFILFALQFWAVVISNYTKQ